MRQHCREEEQGRRKRRKNGIVERRNNEKEYEVTRVPLKFDLKQLFSTCREINVMEIQTGT